MPMSSWRLAARNFCGKIARTFKDGAEYDSPNKGKTLVIDMAPQGDGY